jgi:hypothetical protein
VVVAVNLHHVSFDAGSLEFCQYLMAVAEVDARSEINCLHGLDTANADLTDRPQNALLAPICPIIFLLRENAEGGGISVPDMAGIYERGVVHVGESDKIEVVGKSRE